MSITLTAYPMAFLLSPEDAKKETLKKASDVNTEQSAVDTKDLISIKILTNLAYNELKNIIPRLDCKQISQEKFMTESGLTFTVQTYGKHVIFHLQTPNKKILPQLGESFFKDVDTLATRNVRLIGNQELFYYNYGTAYSKATEIYAILKKEGATQIFSTENDEIVANLNGQNLRYYKDSNCDNFILEVEQKITIMNIGLKENAEGLNVTYGLTDLKIKTNIKQSELRQLLKQANYLFYPENNETPLKNSHATLNWVLKDGHYVAEFSGNNNVAIAKEAEIIFRKLNIAAGRDLRLINDISTTVYTYTTNYTDKGILLNTLIEHGAEEITESGEDITCKLFDMEMVYYKKGNSRGYSLDITQVSNKTECENVINDLNEEYGLNIQEMTYNKIKERLDSENMRLESETVLDDNSIVLTIEV